MRFQSLVRLSRVLFVLSFISLVAAVKSFPSVQAQGQGVASLDAFDMLTDTSGWISIDRHLFWTSNAGQSWEEIGPAISDDGFLQDVEFADPNVGWMLWTTSNSDGSSAFYLAHTADHGTTWTLRDLPLFESSDIASYAEKVEMGWFNLQTGWISVKQNSGSNFSVGTLFTTSDGGNSWNRSSLPVADKIGFRDPHLGWAVGGPSNDQIYVTQDGGVSWENARPSDLPSDRQVMIYPPFVSNGQGLLVATTQDTESSLGVYALQNSLDEWLLISQLNLSLPPGIIGLSILDGQNVVAAIPGTHSILRMVNGEFRTLENRDGRSASIVELDMVTLDIGWAKSVHSSCETASSPDLATTSISCTSTDQLLHTTDGGISWQTVRLPIVHTDNESLNTGSIHSSLTSGTLSTQGNTEVIIGQGFDRCEIPTLSQMQTWATNSPYQAVNLYIGGSSRTCSNNALIASYLYQLHQQGWKFIPTWVGPQAPCTGYLSRMSGDPAIAYQQGVDQANLAVERLAALGLTNPEKTGSIVYYDIEHYGTDNVCRSAVNAFMNGWVAQVRTRGSLAGVYGSTLCNTGLSDFLNITNVPDVIWPARWYHSLGSGYYDPAATVWNLGSCIPNSIWANHQRIRQYEGDHYETWGGLTLDIDSNVLDGVVAFPFDYPFVARIVPTDPNPTNTASVKFLVTFSKPVTGVNQADFALTTSGLSNASITMVSGSGTTYTVTVNTGTGDGSLRLDLLDNDSILDGSNHPLGGAGTGNGNYRYGQAYTIVKATFVDVPRSHMFWDYIEAFYDAALTTGCVSQNPKKYCPNDLVTRGEMATFIERALGNFNPNPNPTGMFADVPYPMLEHLTPFIEEFYNDGITTGCAVNPLRYCPQNTVTRAEMATFIERALGNFNPNPNPTGMFADVPYPGLEHLTPFIEEFYNDGITTGCAANPLRYCPADKVTRAEMAVFIVRAFNISLP